MTKYSLPWGTMVRYRYNYEVAPKKGGPNVHKTITIPAMITDWVEENPSPSRKISINAYLPGGEIRSIGRVSLENITKKLI